ncbi:MAG TPA: S41 family peptidase, partial [Usitatibacteraceae bacterium]|nr:S41 family peptidase [Usitatibacteraceae bacterium]
ADALETVWRTIDERYYDPKLNGVDWRAVRMRYEPLLKATASDDDYWELLDKMAGELKDSHTRVESPKQVQQQRDQESHSLGISFIELDGKLVLTSVHPESDAYWAGARAGMAIRTIDGQDALAHYRSLAAAARESSTAFAKARGAQRKINNGAIGSKLSMVFERPDGSGIEATLERRRFGNPPFVMHRILPSGYGYIRFSGFNESLRSGVLGAIEKLAATPGLILDLRNNGGGSGNMADAILARFFESEQKGMKILTRTGKPVSVFFIDVVKTEPIIKGSGKAAYTKPLVLITNGNSASASEIVAAALQDLGRAQVVGERTCGCLLGFLGHADLPGGGQLAYSEIGFVTNRGRRIEGEGVLPDVEVKPGVEDYRFNRDRALEQAQALLQRKIAAERVQ